MRYDDKDRESSNVEDRRGEGGGGFPFPGGGRGGRMRIPFPVGGGGRGGFSITTLLIIGAIMLFFGINPLDFLREGGDFGQIPQMPRMERPSDSPRSPFEVPSKSAGADKSQDDMKRFVARVLADTEDVWNTAFEQAGRRYDPTRLVLFSGATRTACGVGQAQMGPFYCPLDKKIYVDLDFYEELRRRFKAPGDFAQAYVIAHEVGHHIQTQLGIADQVQQLKASRPQQANQIQVRMELQADCLAGVWANLNDSLNKRLQPGDIEEGLNAASAIGDDMIQKQTQGRVVPESFTHGSSAQRVRWFKRGFEGGNMNVCDTFSASQL